MADEKAFNAWWSDWSVKNGRPSTSTLKEVMRQAWDAALAQSPVLGECEECGHTIVTPLKRFA